jgi:hypothetical protein
MKDKDMKKDKAKIEEPFPSDKTPNPPQVVDPSKVPIESVGNAPKQNRKPKSKTVHR